MNDDVTFNLADGNVVTVTVQVWPVPEGGMDSIAGDLVWSVSRPEIATITTEGNSCTITFTGKNGYTDLFRLLLRAHGQLHRPHPRRHRLAAGGRRYLPAARATVRFAKTYK